MNERFKVITVLILKRLAAYNTTPCRVVFTASDHLHDAKVLCFCYKISHECLRLTIKKKVLGSKFISFASCFWCIIQTDWYLEGTWSTFTPGLRPATSWVHYNTNYHLKFRYFSIVAFVRIKHTIQSDQSRHVIG